MSLTAVFIAAAVLILAARGLFDPFVGLLGLLAVSIVQPGELYPGLAPLHLEKAMAIIVLASFLGHGWKFKFAPVTRWSLAFYAAVVASVPLSIWISNAATNALQFGKTIVYLMLITAMVNTRRRLFWFLLVFMLLNGYLAVTALASYYGGHFAYAEGIDRIVGLTSDANSTDGLALTMASALPLIALFAGRGVHKLLRLVAIGIAGMALWTMLLTGSRMGLIALLGMVGFWVVTSSRRLVLTPTVIALALLLWAALPSQYRNRYANETQSDYLAQDEAYTQRQRIWQSGWHMFLDHPLTGVGAGDFNAADGMFYWKHHWMDAHNLLFKLIGELGLLGTISFTGFLVCLVRTNRTLGQAMAGAEDIPAWQKNYPRAANLAIVMLLLAGYGNHDLYRDTWYLLAGLSGGIWFLLQQEGRMPALARPAPAKGAVPAADPAPVAWRTPA